MALFQATIKRSFTRNKTRYEKGMSVEAPRNPGNTGLKFNGAKDVIDLFQRKYGVDVTSLIASSDIEWEKIS